MMHVLLDITLTPSINIVWHALQAVWPAQARLRLPARAAIQTLIET